MKRLDKHSWMIIVALVALVAATAYAAVRSDLPGQIFNGAVQVTTAAAVKVPTSCAKARNAIAIYNNGPNTIWCGGTAAVSNTTGFPIATTTMLSIDVACNADGSAALWCISDTADQSSPNDTRWIEVK